MNDQPSQPQRNRKFLITAILIVILVVGFLLTTRKHAEDRLREDEHRQTQNLQKDASNWVERIEKQRF